MYYCSIQRDINTDAYYVAISRRMLNDAQICRWTNPRLDNYLCRCVYKRINSYWLCAVTKSLEIDGFIITAYITDKIKEGVKIWPN